MKEQGDFLFTIFFLLIVGANLVWMYKQMRVRRKAGEIGRGLIEQKFNEIKLLADCVLIQTRTFNQKGFLVLFADRVSFIPADKGEKMDMPYGQLERMDVSKSSFLVNQKYGRKLVFHINGQKLQIHINPFLYDALIAALEKMSPMLASSGLNPGIK